MPKTIESSAANPVDAGTGLKSNRDFLNLWIAESISQIGSHVSIIALPLVAILVLDASPAQMGFLVAASTAPALIIGLFVGVWVDRVRRRPLMIAADIVRGLLLLSVPIAWWAGFLSLELLYAVALLAGALTVVFNVAWLTFLPSIVRRSQLVDANSKLQMSESVAQVTGPGAGGALVGLVGAPIAILLDAISYFVSAIFLIRVSPSELKNRTATAVSSVRRDVIEGLAFVYGNEVLRALVYSRTLVEFSAGIFFAVYVLFMANDLGLGATAIGIVFATGGIGSIVGAFLSGRTAGRTGKPRRSTRCLLSDRLSGRLGPGRTVIGGQFWFGIFGLTIPLALLFPAIALVLVILSEFLQWLAHIVSKVNELAIRQASVPDRYLGRVNSVFQFFGRGMTPLGAVAGGLLGEVIGVPATLVVACVGFLAAFLFVLISPVRSFSEIVDS